MTFNRVLLSTCAAVSLIWPATALADPPGDRGQGGDKPAAAAKGHQGGPKGAGRPQQAGPAPHAERPAGAAVQRETRRVDQGGGPGVHPAERDPPPAASAVVATPRPDRGREAQTVRPARPAVPAPPRSAQRAARPAPHQLGDWDRNVSGDQRAQLGQQWRGQNHDWDQSAPWRDDTNWWRRDPGFRRFAGPRIGFFFFPDFGYVRAPPEYRNHYWRAGDNLPSWFWRYKVRDYSRYGLPTPPYGCAWIWLDGDIALVDMRDGYILDVVHNLW
jgi:Ni/Co efflux regulator RcnB